VEFSLGPLGTAATYGPIVPPPGDYYDGEIGGMMIGRGNRSTRRKTVPVPLCPPQTPHACPDANPGRRGGKTATNRLSYGTPFFVLFGLNLVGFLPENRERIESLKRIELQKYMIGNVQKVTNFNKRLEFKCDWCQKYCVIQYS
jgi:hypothetical protein